MAAASAKSPTNHWTVEPEGEVMLKVTLDGVASSKPVTVYEVFKSTAERFPHRNALCVKRGGKWQSWTYEQYFNDVKSAAKSFIRLGLQPHHAVSILGFNSPEWLIADLAAIFAGGFAAGIYTTNGPDACRYVADHSRSNIIVVENNKQLVKILEVKSQLPHLKAIVQYTGTVDAREREQGVLSWDEFMRVGADMPDYELGWRITPQKANHCCTLIYTSGTTGDPKAVMISHDNITWTATTLIHSVKLTEEHIVSYLPLSHIAAQMVDIHAPLMVGATVWFAQPDALKGSLVDTLREVRPTLFLGVPRVWEKIMEKMQSVGAKTTGLKKSIAEWAKEKGFEGGMNIQKGEDTPFGFWLAEKLVFNKVREALGLDRCHFQATAAAPIGRETLDYFLKLNIPVYEVFGMSECTGPMTVSRPGRHRTGSCGPALDGMEIRIMNPDPEGNGEICFRGRHIFMGYLFNEAKTRESIDDDGWLHSGDIGKIDRDGFLYITGRLKEILITAGGENVAPVPIEDNIKSVLPFVANCMTIGDRMKFLSVLLCLKVELDAEGNPTDRLAPETLRAFAARNISGVHTVAEAAAHAGVKALINELMIKVNERAVSNAQKVQKFTIVPRDFSIQGGELGPTLKLKRSVVAKMYEHEIAAMYTGGGGD